jgi:hypothetical protein
MSADGALLSLRAPAVLPPVVLLWEGTGSIHECTVRWRRESLLGVHFRDVRGRATRRAALETRFAGLPDTAAGNILLH